MRRGCLRAVVAVVAVMLVIIFAGPAIVDGCMKYLYPQKYEGIVRETAERFSLDESLVYAVIRAESKFDERAQSAAGAKGLMQLTEGTFTWILDHSPIGGEENPDIWKPENNIYAGCALLRYLIDHYGGEEFLGVALCAYNAGMGNVSDWLGNKEYSIDGKTLHTIPYPETKEYVKRTERNYSIYKRLYDS